MLKFSRAFPLFLNAVIIILLLAIHFVIKENSCESSLLYYMLPLPIIIIAILFLSVFLNKKYRKFNILIASIVLLIWLSRSFKISFSEDIKETDIEVVFWNASRNRGFQDAFTVNKGIPDVLVLVEGHINDIENLQLQFPDYHFYLSEKEIALFSKTPLTSIQENSSKFNSTIIHFKTNSFNFYATDITGSQDVPRSWELGFANKHVKQKENTIVLGDFNVPFESKYLHGFKTQFNHAFNLKGNGFRETWFWNIPLLSLDHIWVSKDLEILKTEKIGTFKSDHSMLKTYVRN